MKIKITKEWLMKHVGKEDCEISAGNPRFEEELFEAWFVELKRVMFLNGFTLPSLEKLHKEEWKFFFDDNCTPAEALIQDLSNA